MKSEQENRASMRGESRKHSRGSETVAEIEHTHAGSPGRATSGGVSFKMPKDSEICDHSKVRELE